MAELNGCRIAAVLSADTAVKLRTGLLSFFYRHLHEHAYAGLIQSCERIALKYLRIVLCAQELAGIVT